MQTNLEGAENRINIPEETNALTDLNCLSVHFCCPEIPFAQQFTSEGIYHKLIK